MKGTRFITYGFTDLAVLDASERNRVREATRTACRFWNHFCEPKHHVLLRVGCFQEPWTRAIARAWQPMFQPTATIVEVELNAKYLTNARPYEATSLLTHELGHALGYGFGHWFDIFDPSNRSARPDFLARQDPYFQQALRDMRIEHSGSSGTRCSHWDEEQYGQELMTGLPNDGSEYVFEITIRLLELLGHKPKLTPKWPYQQKDFRELLSEIPIEQDSLIFNPTTKLRAQQLKTALGSFKPHLPFEVVQSKYW